MQGEHRVARSRLALVAVLTLVGLGVVLGDPSHPDFVRAVPINLACLVGALVIFLVTRRGSHPTGLAFATSIGDVTLVSVLLGLDLWQSTPSVVVNGRVTFLLYFVALVGTCVRFDRRLPIVAGAVAVGQYAGLVWWASAIWPVDVTRDVATYGTFDWGVQVERMVTLAVFAAICTNIATWALQLRTNATRDELTGLTNRRTFEERLQTELLRAHRRDEPLSVAMVDVDHFKRVNDLHGHQAGDEALRAVAGVIRESVRRTDLAARWGGEEFALAFPCVSSDEAVFSLERLRTQLENLALPLAPGPMTQLTISAGVASSPRDGVDVTALVRAADERLLAAKRAGRNRLVSCGPFP